MATPPKKFILDIVPLTRLPMSGNQSFSYLSEKELSIGTLVSIPLFHRQVEGIVLGVRHDFERLGNIELKKIEKVLEEGFLSASQIRLAQFISDCYISPLGIVMKNFVPARTKARRATPPQPSPEYRGGGKNIVLAKEQKNAVRKITDDQLPMTKFLLFGPSGSGKTEVYIHSILGIKKKNPDAQFLILVPEKTLTPQALERYGQYFSPEEIVMLSSNITKGQFYGYWQRIKSGKAKIIIGTRMAVFAPFQKLGLIVIDEEQDMSYKQWDMNPRYDARTAAGVLAEINRCPLVRGSATPAIESYWRAQNKEMILLELPPLTVLPSRSSTPPPRLRGTTPPYRGGNASVEIVDMKKERWAKNYSCISKKLKSEIAYALKYDQQSILFINRQGMSSFSVCKSCKTVLKCPKCDRSLTYDQKGHYRCLHCANKTSITPKCAKCGNIIFENVGLGTQKVEREVKNLFPAARVARLDSQAAKEPDYQHKIYQEFSAREIDILIGTQMVTKGWDLPSVALVGIIDTDNALTIPDFATGEKFYENLVQVAGRVARPGAKFPGMVIVQTYQPENKLIKFAATRDFTAFFEFEIKERKALSFPPFGRLIKLVFQDYAAQKTAIETERAFEALKNIPDIKVMEVQDSFVPKIRGRFRKQIVIKCKKKIITEKLTTELKKLGAGWSIDVDPVSIT
ncbi:MAG: primosomal protein N' [Parcubacteria group bacterium]